MIKQTNMRTGKLLLLCIIVLLLGKVGVAQYTLSSFSNEGIRIDGKPIHPGEQKTSYPPQTVVEIRGQQYQCKILAKDGDPAWLSYCCNKRGIKTIKDAFSRKSKKHFADTTYHEKDGKPIDPRVSPLKGDDKADKNKLRWLFYKYLGDCPTQSGAREYDTIKGVFVTAEKLDSIGVSFHLKETRLIVENKGEKTLFFVPYLAFGENKIKRLNLEGAPKDKMEEWGIDIKGKKYAYVFWCTKWNEKWDCLDDEEIEINCYKVVF